MRDHEERHTPEDLLRWLIDDMEFQPFHDSQGRPLPLPTVNTMRLLNRGNLAPVWDFFLSQVRSEAEVTRTRGNLTLSENEKRQEIQGILTSASFLPTSGAGKLEAPSRQRKPAGKSGSAPDMVRAAATKSATSTVATNKKTSEPDIDHVSRKREVAKKQVDLLRKQVVDAECRLKERVDQLTQTSFQRDLSRHSATMVRAGAASLSAYDSLCKKRVQILNEYSKKMMSLADYQGLSALPRFIVAGILEGVAESNEENIRSHNSSHTAAKRRNTQQDQLQELVDEKCKRQAASIRRTLSASYNLNNYRNQTDHDLDLLTPKMEVGPTHNNMLDSRRHGTPSKLSTRRNVDLLVTTPRQSLPARRSSLFPGDKITSSPITPRKLSSGDWGRWPSHDPPPSKPESKCECEWLEMTLQNPVDALRALAMGVKRLAEEVQSDTTSIDVQRDAQTQRDEFERDRRQGQDHRGEGMGATGQRGVWIRDRGARSGDSGTDELLRERQRAHVEQLKATEIACTKANSTLRVSNEVVQSLQGYWISVTSGGASPSMVEHQHTPRNLEVSAAVQLAVWELERKVVGLKAFNNTLTKEVANLQGQCEARREVRARLCAKWQAVKEFDAKKEELQEVGDFLRSKIQAASTSWEKHMEVAAHFSSDMLIPACEALRRELSLVRQQMHAERRVHLEIVKKRLPPIPAVLMEGGVDLADATVWRNACGEGSGEGGGGRECGEDGLGAVLREGMLSRIEDENGVQPPADLLHAAHLLLPTSESYSEAVDLMEERLILKSRIEMWETHLSLWGKEMEEPQRRVSVCGDCYAEQKREEEEEWEPQLEAALKKAANVNGKGIMDVKRALRECVDRPAGFAADWMTVNDSEARSHTLAEWMRVVRGHTAKIFEATNQST